MQMRYLFFLVTLHLASLSLLQEREPVWFSAHYLHMCKNTSKRIGASGIAERPYSLAYFTTRRGCNLLAAEAGILHKSFRDFR